MSKHKKITTNECGNRSGCALANTLDVIGDKWTLLIIRDMLFIGKNQFGDFLESPEGISTNILTNRLKKLEQFGIITKHPYQKKPVRYEYSLTELGLSLEPVITQILQWGLTYIDGAMKPTDKQLAEMRQYYNQRRKI